MASPQQPVKSTGLSQSFLPLVASSATTSLMSDGEYFSTFFMLRVYGISGAARMTAGTCRGEAFSRNVQRIFSFSSFIQLSFSLE
jgi:hypothetical protein